MTLAADPNLPNKSKRKIYKPISFLFLAFFFLPHYLCFAASNPSKSIPSTDAGSVKKQIESQLPPSRKAITPKKPEPIIGFEAAPAEISQDKKEEPPIEGAEGFKFLLKQLIFRNVKIIDVALLEDACKDFLQSEFGVEDLEDIKARVIATYRKQGYLADVILPEQDLTDGILTMDVIEAKVGRFIIIPDDDVVISDNLFERINGLVLKNSPPGSPVDLDNFEKVSILLSDLQGITPIPSIKAGDILGTTDLVLKISKKPTFRGLIITDNAGVDLNFKKLSTQLSLSSLFNRGELISAFTSINEGSVYGRLGLTTPITLGHEWNGTMLDINTTRLQYQTISSNVNLGGLEPPSGKSYSIGSEITHPLHRSLNANLWISGGYLMRESADKDRNIYDTDTKITTGKVYSLGINGNYFDAFLLGGINQFNLKLLQGDSQYLGNQSTIETSNQDGAAGHFRKTVISLARQQLFINSWSLTTVVSAQNANKNLESAEKFTLGGSAGVRAFPGSEGSGSRGFMLKNDLTKSFTDDLQASLFYDWGWVQRYVIRQGPQGQKLPLYDNEANTGSLSGYGFNVVYNPFKDFNLNITLARRTKANPFALKNDPERNGKDTDGTLIMNRWWITMNYRF